MSLWLWPVTAALSLGAAGALSSDELNILGAAEDDLAAVLADDECSGVVGDWGCCQGKDGHCSFSALQIRGVRRGDAPTQATGSSEERPEAHVFESREVGDKHGLNRMDMADYREDATAFLSEVLADKENIESMCDLTSLTYADVIARWSNFEQEWMSRLPADTPPGRRRAFHNLIREAFPEVLYQGNPVVIKNGLQEIGWNASDWDRARIETLLGDLQFEEMGFGYPAWLGNSIDIGLGAGPDGKPKTISFADYFKQNRSAADVFLFLNEEDPMGEPRIRVPGESKATRLLRSSFSPTPPFAHPSKSRLALLAIDGKGSSHGFHEHTAVWQVQVQGYKMWHFMPPSTPLSLGYRVRGGSPMVKGKPFEHPNGCAFLKKVERPPGAMRCLAGPGDMVIMPANWVHATCGLNDYTASAGGWLHAEIQVRDQHPLLFLESQLGEIKERAHRNDWARDDIYGFSKTDEEEEEIAGLPHEKALLERKLHAFDYDSRVGAIPREEAHAGQRSDAPQDD